MKSEILTNYRLIRCGFSSVWEVEPEVAAIMESVRTIVCEPEMSITYSSSLYWQTNFVLAILLAGHTITNFTLLDLVPTLDKVLYDIENNFPG